MTWTIGGHERDEKFRCVEWCKRNGLRCKNPSVQGTKLCRKHGGRNFLVQVRFTQEHLDEAVKAHLRWLGHDTLGG